MTTSSCSRLKREFLFRKSRPKVRKYEQSDAGFLWAAYQGGSLPLERGLSQRDFLLEIAKKYGEFDLLWIIEDDSKSFKSGRGQIGLVGIKADGWTFRPSAVFFKWATPKNILRSLVGFFQMIRYQKDVGICRVEILEKDLKMLSRLKKYGVLFYRGRIPSGSSEGDLFVFSIQGKKAA